MGFTSTELPDPCLASVLRCPRDMDCAAAGRLASFVSHTIRPSTPVSRVMVPSKELLLISCTLGGLW